MRLCVRTVGGMGSRAAAALCVILLAGCGGGAPERAATGRFPVDAIDGENALRETADLVAIYPRVSGTPGAMRAAEHIAARLRSVGWEARLDAFEDEAPGGPTTFVNVLAEKRGDGNAWIVLGSHFDSKAGMPEGFQGANDSGSSSGLLIEIARALANRADLPFHVMLAFFDGEECAVRYGPNDGLHGSRRLAAQLVESGRAAEVKAVMILDMVGDRDLTITLPRNNTPALNAACLASSARLGVREHFGLHAGAILDDHVPFLDAGMPAAAVIDFEFGTRPGRNDLWHTAGDTMDKLSADSLSMVGRVVFEVLNGLAGENP
jgi:glutaminyl-peptide cyclotransferase